MYVEARRLLLHAIQNGLNQAQTIDLFKQHGYELRYAVYFFAEVHVSLPHEIEYTDKNPSPDRKEILRKIASTK